MSREKLALVCDSTSAPVCSLMPFSGWGTLLLGLIVASTQSANALTLLITSILFNFYLLIVVVWVFLVIVFNINIAPMKHAVPHPIEPSSSPNDPSPWLMIAPIVVVIAMVPPIALLYRQRPYFRGERFFMWL